MPSKERYHITKREDGLWQGKKEGSDRASSVESTQEKAIKAKTKMAKNHGEAQVIIHKVNGKIREEHTYGSDPFPPEG